MENVKMEIWKDIPGYEGRYKVSNLGRVKSLERKRKGPNGCLIRVSEKLLTAVTVSNKDGYKRQNVCLSKDGIYSTPWIHQLVLLAFIGPCPEGYECRHLNGDATKNDLGNLAYSTHKENIYDKFTHGTIANGERHGMSLLTEEEVLYVRRQLINAPRGTIARLARELGVDPSTISLIKRNLNWKHVA